MKRTACAFALLLMSCLPASAAVRYGFDIGLTMSSLQYDHIDPFSPMSLWTDHDFVGTAKNDSWGSDWSTRAVDIRFGVRW